MTMLSIVCTKLLCTNAHLGLRVADHHFKVYIRGSRNGIAILDSDKTLICLRNALHFIGSPIRQKGRSFFLKTNHLFIYEITEEMASYLRSYLRNVNSHCFDDSQWKIGAFLTNSFANKKKFRSRKKKINFGLNQQPDCVVILNADRKSSVRLEADRSQIPIPSLVDSTIPWESYKRITYPIPANDPIQFVYLFRHSIMKTVILKQNAISRETPPSLSRGTFKTVSTGMHSTSSPRGRKVSLVRLNPMRTVSSAVFELLAAAQPFFTNTTESLPQPQGGAAQIVQETPAPQGFTELQPIQGPAIPLSLQLDFQSQAHFLDCMTRHAIGENNMFYKIPGRLHNPILENYGGAGPSTSTPPILENYGGAGPSTSNPPMDLSPTMDMDVSPTIHVPLSKEQIYFNLVHLDATRKTSGLSQEKLMTLVEIIYIKKSSILAELMDKSGPQNCHILWNTDGAGNAIRKGNGEEYDVKTLREILKSLRSNEELRKSHYLGGIWKRRISDLPKAKLKLLRVEDIPGGIYEIL
ncbi:uncharacterized protein LOC123441282 [Hordeum vulgare subsp. vulgare]|uniref:uncharacterized protein LOC123441282 n=1 Tax=Hordeum vulgare subsp. vulgare TaxID=112509 RepID=UPI001D1A462B|nr:uncharacterized protein LOC123441282 [Hordeum vulgare subsp. vulgare]